MCVNTIVLTRPMRRASHAAPRCESGVEQARREEQRADGRLADAEALEEEVRQQRR